MGVEVPQGEAVDDKGYRLQRCPVCGYMDIYFTNQGLVNPCPRCDHQTWEVQVHPVDGVEFKTDIIVTKEVSNG